MLAKGALMESSEFQNTASSLADYPKLIFNAAYQLEEVAGEKE